MIQIDSERKIPLYEQLYKELKRSILYGELKTNAMLKPVRVLAKELDISHNTVNRAYQQLLAEGYVRAIQGSGFYVEEIPVLKCRKEEPVAPNRDEERESDSKVRFDFSYDSFSGKQFPWSKWCRYVKEAILSESYEDQITFESNKGLYDLRRSICEYVRDNRGINCTPEQIVISSGTRYIMDLIMNILPPKEYLVGIENPVYDGMMQVFKNKCSQIYPISVSEDGIDVDELEKSECNLLYITPSHQFPTGATLNFTKRMQIVDWARRNSVFVIENDSDNSFMYGERPILAIQSMDHCDQVFYVDTFSKIMSPELRCAFVVLPKKFVPVYEEKYKYYHTTLPCYDQRALANFIMDGNYEREARKSSILNQKKLQLFRDTIEKELANLVEIFSCPSSTHYLMRIKGCTDQKLVIRKLLEKGIRIYPTERYYYDSTTAPANEFLMGVSLIDFDQIEEACKYFADILKIIKNN